MGVTMVKIKCAHCGKKHEKYVGHVNRARKLGLNLYCNKKCAGFGRRIGVEEKKRRKHEYDQTYTKQDWYPLYSAFLFHLDYAAHPEKFREIRRKKYKKHLEYLRTKKYRQYKKRYDQKYHARKLYGEYWESAILVEKIDSLINKQQSRQDRNCHNKTQKRKRLCQSQRLTQ